MLTKHKKYPQNYESIKYRKNNSQNESKNAHKTDKKSSKL